MQYIWFNGVLFKYVCGLDQIIEQIDGYVMVLNHMSEMFFKIDQMFTNWIKIPSSHL
jgi:hypothetical protein